MTEPPAEILRRLRPIPTYVDHPTTVPRNVVGLAPDGTPRRVVVEDAAVPVLLLFLSSGCLGCRDLWEGLGALHAGLADAATLTVVTRGAEAEDQAAIAVLAGPAEDGGGATVVMSTRAFEDYRVAGPPFLVVAAGDGVRTESVAWGLEQTLRIALNAVGRVEP